MIALCVDDEQIPLQFLKEAVKESDKVSEVHAFEDEIDALEWAGLHACDVAFLDIELHSMNGLEVAEKLLEIHPQMAIVFCTSYEQYAVRTIKMHIDAGYLVKPFRKEQVHEELDHIAKNRSERHRLKVKCFGDFEVFVDNVPLKMRRRRTKELLAYLIDRRGASVTSAQICAALWEDEGPNGKKMDMLYHLVTDLRSILKKNGLDNVFISGRNGYSVNTAAVECDFYHLLDGDEQAKKLYLGEYMNQYSWAEYTNSWIERELKKE